MKNHEHNIIGARIQLIMEILGLEVAGFEMLTGVSASHLYAILNGNRRLTIDVANQIGEKIGFDGWKILHVSYEIPSSIRQHPNVSRFYKEYSSVPDYFIDTRDERKKSFFIKQLAITTDFFNEERYVWEVKDKAKEVNRKFTSKELSQILKNLFDNSVLNRKKRQYRSKDGNILERLVWVYFKEIVTVNEEKPGDTNN